MNVVYYRMVNGYGYVPCTGSMPMTSPVTGQPQAVIGNGFGSIAGSGQGLGQGLGMLGGQQALMPTPAANPLGMSTALASNPLATNPLANGASSYMPKWMLPNYSSTQIQYMFRPRMTKTKTSKPVRCETCNITLNSEQQAKQHFTGKSHLKKLRQLNAPADEKEKKKSTEGESSEKKKSEKADGKKTDGGDDDESVCSESTDDAVSSSGSKTKKNTDSSSEKCTLTAAPPAGVTETASAESSTCVESTNKSGKDMCASPGSDTTSTTTTTTKSITIVHLESSSSSSSPLQTPSEKGESERSKSKEAASLSPDHSSKEQSNSSPSPHQSSTTTRQSSGQQNYVTKTSNRDRYRRQTSSSSPSDSTRQQYRGNAGWGKTNTWGGYRSNGDLDVVHNKPPFAANFLMRSMMQQLQHQYQAYGAAGSLPDRSSLLAIDGATTHDITANPSPPCMSLSPPVAQYATQPFAPSATALVPYTPNLINPTTASGLLTPSLMSASTGFPTAAVYPTSAAALPTAQGMAMMGYSNGLAGGGLYAAGNGVNGLSMYYKTEPSSLPANGGNGMLSNGLNVFLGSELTYRNGAATAVADGVYNGHQGATQTNDTTMYYQSSTTASAAASNGIHQSMLYQNSVSIPGGSTDHGQSSSSNDDPVSKAVMDNIMGRLARKRKTDVSCEICDVTFSSDWQATEHFRGARHTKRAKSTDRDGEEQHKQKGQMHRATIQRRHAEQGLASKGPGWQEVSGYKMGWLHCKTCDISVPTSSQLQRHVVSESHRNKQETQLVAMSGHQWAPPAL